MILDIYCRFEIEVLLPGHVFFCAVKYLVVNTRGVADIIMAGDLPHGLAVQDIGELVR